MKVCQPHFLESLSRFLLRHQEYINRIDSLEQKLSSYLGTVESLKSSNRLLRALIEKNKNVELLNKRESIYTLVKDLSNVEWYNLLLESSVSSNYNGIELPGFPDEQTQKKIIGASNKEAISQIWGFYSKFHEYTTNCGNTVEPDKKLLDFGVGWGRIYRFFIKDFKPENLIGVDIDRDFVEMSQKLIPYGNFIAFNGHPPLNFDDGSFDYLTAFSVFTHLNKPIANAWIKDFARILKKGSILYITVYGKRHISGFIPHYDKARQVKPELPKRSLNAFYKMYDNGEFIYSPSGGGGVRTADIYGWTVLSPTFIKNNWCQQFDFIDLTDDHKICGQNILVMQRN